MSQSTGSNFNQMRDDAKGKAQEMKGKAEDMASDVQGKAEGMAADLQDKAYDLAEDARAELAALRDKVESLMSERVTPALSRYADDAEVAYNAARDQFRDGSQVIGERVREQPILALGIAALLGFVLASLFRR